MLQSIKIELKVCVCFFIYSYVMRVIESDFKNLYIIIYVHNIINNVCIV